MEVAKKQLEAMREQRFLLAFYGRNLGNWEEIAQLPMKETRWLASRVAEEIEKTKVGKGRKGQGPDGKGPPPGPPAGGQAPRLRGPAPGKK